MSERLSPHFDGATYDGDRDHDRLTSQLLGVQTILFDGEWHTLSELEERTGYPQASISARIRDLRKAKFGGWHVARRYVERGLFEYCLTA